MQKTDEMKKPIRLIWCKLLLNRAKPDSNLVAETSQDLIDISAPHIVGGDAECADSGEGCSDDQREHDGIFYRCWPVFI